MKRKRLFKLLNLLATFALVFSLLSPAVSAQGINRNVKQGPTAEPRVSYTEQVKKLVEIQSNILKNQPTIHSSLENVADDAWVDVIVQFSEDPVALAKGKKEAQGETFSAADAKSVEQKVKSQQANFEKQLKNEKVQYEKRFTYNKVLNGMSLKVKGKDLKKIAQLEGVVRIDPNTERYALNVDQTSEVGTLMDRTNDHLNIPELWDRGITGKGVKVAVLDTGIDYEHPDPG